MSEKLVAKYSPYTAAELVDCGWVSRTRSAVLKDGYAVRVGPFLTVQAQVIQLPNNGVALVDLKQCVTVVAMLDGTIPIPKPIPKP